VLHEDAANQFDFGRVMYQPDPGLHVYGGKAVQVEPMKPLLKAPRAYN